MPVDFDVIPAWLFTAFQGLLFALSAFFLWRWWQRRQAAVAERGLLEARGKELGYSFEEFGDLPEADQALGKLGPAKSDYFDTELADILLSGGIAGQPFRAWDYECSYEGLRICFSFFVLEVDAETPSFSILPKPGILERDLLGNHMQFDGGETERSFGKHYLVKATDEDEARVRGVIGPEVMAFMLENRPMGLVCGDARVVLRFSEGLSAETLETRIALMQRAAGLIGGD